MVSKLYLNKAVNKASKISNLHRVPEVSRSTNRKEQKLQAGLQVKKQVPRRASGVQVKGAVSKNVPTVPGQQLKLNQCKPRRVPKAGSQFR